MSLEGRESGPKRLRFVSEKELVRQRQEREARGETEAPYNPDDQKPLWQRLQEQREAAEAAQQELFANRPPRELDAEELAFLRDVEAAEDAKERAEEREVQRALHEFKREQAASVVAKRAAPETRAAATLAQFDLAEDVHVAPSGRVSVVVVEAPRHKRARGADTAPEKKEKEEKEKEDSNGGECNLLDGAYDSD